MARDKTAGPDSGPVAPFPIRLSGHVIKGFGRGSKELGIPTANLPISGLDIGGHSDIESGVYFGWAGLNFSTAHPSASTSADASKPFHNQHDQHDLKHRAEHLVSGVLDVLVGSAHGAVDATETRTTKSGQHVKVYPMVASIGYNPFYKNEKRSVEVHVIHQFEEDFYWAMMNLSILGFIRKELDYDGLEALVKDIKIDIDVAGNSLARHAYAQGAKDKFLVDFSWGDKVEAKTAA